MIASELAVELGVDPGVITKRLSMYVAAKGIERTRILDEQTVTDMRKVHQLLVDYEAPTVKIAVQKVLGHYNDPIPPDSVRELFSRLQSMETKLATTLRHVEQITAILQVYRQQEEAAALMGTTT